MQDSGPKKATAKPSNQEDDLAILETYSKVPFAREIREVERQIGDLRRRIDQSIGVRDMDTGLVPRSQWDFDGDRQMLATQEPLNVAHCEKALPDPERPRYIISIAHVAKFVVGLGKNVAPQDISEGSRVGVDRRRYAIQLALHPRIDPIVTTMQVEEKPNVTYDDVGGCTAQKEKIQEILEKPLLHPELFTDLGIDPPKGALLYGPPGTGKTLLARAVANRTESVFIRVIGSELVQKYIGEGARMVREIFQMARSKKSCIIFFDEVDAFGGARFGDADGAEHEVQRTMLELITQLDGFDSRGNVKVLMATNRPDTLDPALLRPGRLDRKIEFGVPDLDGRKKIFEIHLRSMQHDKQVRLELLARLCPNSTGADIRSVCTEAGIIAIRARRHQIVEEDLVKAINKVIRGYAKFSATPSYMQYN
jgi:26S proteasome regulatory subunit T1